MKGILRAGILGCGSIAQKHAQAIAALPDRVKMVALCDHTPAKASALGEQYANGRATIFDDYRALIEQVELDLLVICLPPYRHSDEVERAAAHGIHLLVEKPLTLVSEDAWRMVRAVEHAGIKTQAGFIYRFGRAVEELGPRVKPGSVGLFSGRYFCNSLHAPWWHNRDKSGGQLVEQAIHLIDLMRYLMGEPVTVYSRRSNFFHRAMPDYTVEDVSATVFGFANSALGVIYATNGAVPGKWIKEWRVVTPGLVAEFTDWNHATFTDTRAPRARIESIADDQNVFLLQMQDLIEAIRMGRNTRTPLREGARSLDLALAAVRSAEERVEIGLESQYGFLL